MRFFQMKQIILRNERLERMTFPITRECDTQKKSFRGGHGKRAFDVALALIAISVLSPLLLILALVVKLSDGGPAFFSHNRIGADGKAFKVWKFRTMVPDADLRLREHLERNPLAEREWQASRKLQSDPRVTQLGHVLRKYSVDELPQLFNILLGEMSFVGPRPITEAECVLYGRSLRHYFACKPGLTGIWQVSGRCDVTYQRRVALDRYYSTHWTPLLDAILLLKTVPVALSGRGSY